MQLRRGAAAYSAALFLAVLLLISPTSDAFNVTLMLNKHPEFSTFNHYLSVTQLAPEINRRRTITVCTVDNPGMEDLLAKHLTLGGIKNVLSYHVLLDYFDAKKLHQITDGSALAATMYQATGSATGSSGFINITDLTRGKVGFSPEDNGGNISATFVKSVEAQPYDISIIQISNLLPSAEAEAPAPAPEPCQVNITKLMSAHGCKVFADTLSSSHAETTFEDNICSGLTIFCPGDEAMKAFLPKYKNLTAADQQSLLEYHGMPIYESLPGLRSGNGLTSTLATVGNGFFFTVQNDGTEVTIITKLVTAKILNSLVDNQPLAIFQVNKVLMPPELSKLGGLAPAPIPGPAAQSPRSSKSKQHKSPPGPSGSPADAPDGDVADQNSSGAQLVEIGGEILGALILTAWSTFLLL